MSEKRSFSEPEGTRPPSALDDLRRVRSTEGRGVYASDDVLFRSAIFGRDSAVVARDLLERDLEIAREVIGTLASLQGKERNATTEEEPGKIIHEYRAGTVDGKKITGASREILDELLEKWADERSRERGELAYYGSVDVTPLYANLVLDYADRDPGLLETRAKHRSGETISIRESLRRAIDWIKEGVRDSSAGLLEYRRRNPRGHENQGWRDSRTALMHRTGELANHEAPVAALEVQGIAYDALRKYGETFGDPEAASAAERLRGAVLEKFWMEEEGYFAAGVDRDKDGRIRRIETAGSSAGELLETGMFDDLPESERKKYVSSIVRKLFGPDFLTDVGVRSRALSEQDVVDFADYHGGWTVWLKENFTIANGLHRQGFHGLAEELERRTLNAVNVAGENLEFFYVAPDGSVLYDARHPERSVTAVEGTNIPERGQAWTTSAVLMIKHRNGHPAERTEAAPWVRELEADILDSINRTDVYRDRAEISAKRPAEPAFRIDTEKGRAKNRRYRR